VSVYIYCNGFEQQCTNKAAVKIAKTLETCKTLIAILYSDVFIGCE